MADWFKLHENWFTEPRLQWAIKEQATVVQVWLWALTECCRTKSDTIGLHSEDYEMIGIQQLLNLSPGLFNQGLNLLNRIKYISIDKDLRTIKVLKWNDFQSDYLRKKDHRESVQCPDSVRQSPTKSDSVVLEERRVEENREDKKELALSAMPQKPKRTVKLCDEEFSRELIKTFVGVDVPLQFSKMKAWLLANPGRQLTRRFAVNWLNKVDRPLSVIPEKQSDKYSGPYYHGEEK